MNYPIYTQTEKLLNEGNNREERRPKLNVNWFDAVDCTNDRRGTDEVLGGLAKAGEDDSKGTKETISNVNT